MANKSLRSTLNQNTFLTIFAVGLATIISVLAFSYFKTKVLQRSMIESLLKSSAHEVDLLLPTILLPEQEAGAKLILERIKENEELESSELVHFKSELPTSFGGCVFSKVPTTCMDSRTQSVASLTPVTDGDQEFGYLLKVKKLPLFWDYSQIGFVIYSISLAFALIAMFLFFGMTRVTAKDVPQSLNLLVSWIDDWTPERGPSDRPNFRFQEFNDLADRIARVVQERQKEREQINLGKIAAQVAHDIRSPLAALSLLETELRGLDEPTRVLVRSAVNRIKDIANNLNLQNTRTERNERSPSIDGMAAPETRLSVLLPGLIEPLITEKRTQFSSKPEIDIHAHINASSYGLFVKVQPIELKRAISNLINNAVEALVDRGTVSLTLNSNDSGTIELSIRDNGKGIPLEILSKLAQRGATFGKQGGSGLGLYHARTSIESWGGRFKIESKFGEGTCVRLELPRSECPDWFVSELTLNPSTALVILDDDLSIHQIWQARADSIQAQRNQIQIVHLFNPDQLRKWCGNNPDASKSALYLSDYELIGFEETGLTLIEEMGLGPQSILVTSRYEEPHVTAGCRELKVKLLPKGTAAYVPIVVSASPSRESLFKNDAELRSQKPGRNHLSV